MTSATFKIKSPKDLPSGAIVLYRIRRKTDGRFSDGGNWTSFSRKGKLWTSGTVVKSHLTRAMTRHQTQLRHARVNEAQMPGHKSNYTDENFVYNNCEIVEYILLEGTAIIADVKACF